MAHVTGNKAALKQARVVNNFHCLEGLGFNFWRAEATGMARTGVAQGPNGARLTFAQDTDGLPKRDGGMFNPDVATIRPGAYFRFFGTIAHNRFGAESCMGGPWWIDYENYVKVHDFARDNDISMARAAQRLLVIPDDWHDCGYVGKAWLQVPLRAFVGRGEPATGSISVANADRDPRKAPAQTSPAHLNMKQLFFPGNPPRKPGDTGLPFLSRFFKVEWAQRAIRKGDLPPR